MVIGCRRSYPSPGGSGNKADLHEVRLAYVFNGSPFLADSGGNGIDAHGAAVKFINDGLQNLIIQIIQADFIHMKGLQRF